MPRFDLRVVMILSDALGGTKTPTCHEYRCAGQTRCGKRFYITTGREQGEVRMEFVHRRHAEKFAKPCKRCARG